MKALSTPGSLAIVLTIVVKIEENREKYCKGNRKENVPNTNIPEMNQPRAVTCGKESLAGRECSNINIPHMTNVNKSSEEDNGQRGAIILKELPNKPLEKVAVTQLPTDPCTHQDKECNHDAQVSRCFSHRAPLSGEDLNTLLKIDASNVKPKDVT